MQEDGEIQHKSSLGDADLKQRIPEEEARALLNTDRLCYDPQDWVPSKMQFGTYTLEAGLVEADGTRSGFQVQLIVHRGGKTGLGHFHFDLFRATVSGPEPVYGLHVKQSPKALKTPHNLPHEHIGRKREAGELQWVKWNMFDALAHFTKMTRITFIPSVADPEEFVLKP